MTIEVTPPARDTAPNRGDGCELCGFEADALPAAELVASLRRLGDAYRYALGLDLTNDDPVAHLTARPAPGAWSALEHAGHVRDVLHALRSRIGRMGSHDHGTPVLGSLIDTPPSGADDLPPAVLVDGIERNAAALARTLTSLSGDGWLRAGVRDGVRVRVLDLAREAVHAGQHGLAQIAEAVGSFTQSRLR